jgi:AcrR family transcriptional regulator
MFDVPRLKIRERSGVYQNGQERVAQILETALDILIDSGYQAVTLREIARRCGIRIGAISHYYKSRSDLVQDLLNSVIASYLDSFNAIRDAPDVSAEDKLEQVIRLILDDIQTKKTTRLFPQLWALANHDAFVAPLVDSIYIKARLVLNDLIAELNPALNEQERETLALFVSASLEGSTVFTGFEKPWTNEMPLYRAIACRAFIELVKTITPDQLAAYGWTRKDLTPGWTPPTMLGDEDYRAILDSWRNPQGAEGSPDVG